MNTYLKSGVDIDSGNKLVETIKLLVETTARSGVMGNIGSFGALFNLSAIGKKYDSPILVSSTDGVGTKLCIAQEVGNHTTIGVDLVAMCVNDLLAQGAEPLFFLDYFATGKLDQQIAVTVIESIVKGCRDAQVALIGGETAEMPGMYSNGKYDLAGFSVGIVEMSDMLPRSMDINSGDIILGIASNGLHSNGFSLVRKIAQDLGINYNDKSLWNNQSWSEVLLEPTRIYVRSILSVMHLVKGIAHITGGGLVENVPRILPKNFVAQINLSSWTMPEIFQWLEKDGKICKTEMLRTFNCGIGMVLIVSPSNVEALQSVLTSKGEKVYVIGHIANKKAESKDQVIFL